jgi:hypothetical protein
VGSSRQSTGLGNLQLTDLRSRAVPTLSPRAMGTAQKE